MANILLSTNMNLPVPIVGQEAGPQYATDVNSCLTIVDQHNHTSGSGVQIPSAGININSDLSFGSNNATTLRSTRYVSQASPLALASDLLCLYVSNGNLYYNDNNGVQIPITASGAVAGTPGSIANLVSPASASYSSGTSTFVFRSGANTPGNIDGASFILRNLVANSHGLTLSPPNSMSSDYTITLPTLPGTLSFMSIDTSGNMGTITTVGGITGSNIAAGTITGSNIASGTITSANIASQGVARSNLPAVNQYYSAATTQTVSANTFVGITNFISTSAFTGRPVMVGLSPATGAANTAIELSSASSSALAFFGVFVDNVQFCQIRLGSQQSGITTSTVLDYPPGVINCMIPPSAIPAGNHQIDIRMLIATGASVSVVNCSMYYYELMGS